MNPCLNLLGFQKENFIETFSLYGVSISEKTTADIEKLLMDKITTFDTSSLMALLKINQPEILRNPYSQIVIKEKVFTE